MGELRELPSGEMFNENGAIVDDLWEDLSDEDEDDEGGTMVDKAEEIGV